MDSGTSKVVDKLFSVELGVVLRKNQTFFRNVIQPALFEKYNKSIWESLLLKDLQSQSDEGYDLDRQFFWKHLKPTLSEVVVFRKMIDHIAQEYLEINITNDLITVSIEKVLRLLFRIYELQKKDVEQEFLVKLWFDNRETYQGSQETFCVTPITGNKNIQSVYSSFPLAFQNGTESFRLLREMMNRYQ